MPISAAGEAKIGYDSIEKALMLTGYKCQLEKKKQTKSHCLRHRRRRHQVIGSSIIAGKQVKANKIPISFLEEQ